MIPCPSRISPERFRKALRLHRAKTDCFLSLAENASENERLDFISYDNAKEALNTAARFGGHREEIAENLPLINRLTFGEITEPKGEFDFAIILGSANCGYRAERAFEKFGGSAHTRFIVSGGNIHSTGGVTEAAFIKETLLKKGADKSRGFVEDRSANTEDNLYRTAELIKAMPDVQTDDMNICIVTAGFHIMRARLIMEAIPFYKRQRTFFLHAYGPNTVPDSWFETHVGRQKIYDEIRKVSAVSGLGACLADTLFPDL